MTGQAVMSCFGLLTKSVFGQLFYSLLEDYCANQARGFCYKYMPLLIYNDNKIYSHLQVIELLKQTHYTSSKLIHLLNLVKKCNFKHLLPFPTSKELT